MLADILAQLQRKQAAEGESGVATAFKLNWESLEPETQKLICLLSLFAQAPIPWSLIESAASASHLEFDIKANCNILIEQYLLQEVGKDTYQIHDRIRELVHVRLEELTAADELKRGFCQTMVAAAQSILQTSTQIEIAKASQVIPHLAEAARVDRDWLSFAVGFYDALGAGQNYEFAYKLDCLIQVAGIPQKLIPQLITKRETLPSNSSEEPATIYIERPPIEDIPVKDVLGIDSPVSPNQAVVNLSQWLQNVIDTSWQPIEEILGTQGANFVLARGVFQTESVIRAQRIYLESQVNKILLALEVAVRPTSAEDRDIRLQVHSSLSKALPSGLKCIVLDISGKNILEVQATNTDKWIQINIKGKLGEQFSVQIQLGDAHTIRSFMI